MDILAWLAVAATTVVVIAVVVWRQADRRDRHLTKHTPNQASPAGPAMRSATELATIPEKVSEPYAGLANTEVLIGPPVVDLAVENTRHTSGDVVSLRDWLVHLHPDTNIWAEVVTEFYTAAAADPVIASYFADVDMDELQKHFLATLMILTGSGLTVGTYRQMNAKHAEARNTDGDPITPDVYDAAIAVLVDVLRAKRVPEETLAQVAFLVAPLREAITGEGSSA